MSKRLARPTCAVLGLVTLALAGLGSTTATARSTAPVGKSHPSFMATVQGQLAPQTGTVQFQTKTLQPPPVFACIPGQPLPPIPNPLGGYVNANCVPPAPPAGEPWPGNLAYFGGHVQTTPHIYLVFFGWGRPGAFGNSPCAPETIVEGRLHAVLKCDPDGAGKRMADFVQALGGTKWAGVQDQYYQTTKGFAEYIQNPNQQLSGIWVDDTNKISDILDTTPTPQCPTGGLCPHTFSVIAREADLARKHFNVGTTSLLNAQFIVMEPKMLSDPMASSVGYCAWHDYTEPDIEGHIYAGLQPGISFTNMPYVLNQGANCGSNIMGGKLDGLSIVLGHEIEETVTDPGAGDVENGVQLGAWIDVNGYENGDKCAWVGASQAAFLGVGPALLPGVPGEVGIMTARDGTSSGFPVQALWSNRAAEGMGYCEGAGTDLPQPVPPV